MRLYRAAHARDSITATDAYGTASFKCQLAPLELFKIEGTKVKVRQLSTAPDVTIPARGAIRINGDVFLIGHGSTDFWKGEPIRVNYVTQGADGLATLTTIEGALAAAPGVQAYASAEFSRYMPEGADSSKYPPQYELFLAESETIAADMLVSLNGLWYLVKESYKSPSGVRVALANVLADPVFETVSLSVNTYDPVADATTSVTTSHPIMRVKWTEHYTYLSIGTETYERGDQQVFMLKTATPKPSDTLTLSDGTWRILAVQDEGTRWSCHVRRS